MKNIKIIGGQELTGTINISGAKNAAVAIIPAAILSDDIVTISNVPNVADVDALESILQFLNIKVTRNKDVMVIDNSEMENKRIPEKTSKKLRASYYFMGALLGKYNKVEMHFPGGCNIGKRPINLHLMGFEELGATVIENNNNFKITADKLIGDRIYLDFPSVGATINIMLAAVKACGETIIDNAAREPEIVNVATFLNSMGAKIIGAGTSIIKIKGVKKLGKGFAEVIPDRIEAGTYSIVGALLGNNLKITNIIPTHLESLIEKLQNIGASFEVGDDYILFYERKTLKTTNVRTNGYPGFPTDLQQPFSVLMTQCKGTSKIEETMYENRFMHIKYLNKMGAKIKIQGSKAIINGITPLKGKEVVATDLRAGAALVIAGLIAKGKTTIEDIDHILRGYDRIVDKLTNVGAKIEII